MCGLGGYIGLQANSNEHSVSVLQRMMQLLSHRGPDGYGIWCSDTSADALVHCRLQIIDLTSAGAQPMWDAQHDIVLVFNGEIYNHAALRSELEQRGHVYRSMTDTETIIYAYKEWGIECIKRFKGMFAFVLYDQRTHEWYLVRDQIGVKPLYFSLHGGYCSFASEIKALWCLPWLQKSLSIQGLYHYLTFLVTPAPLTMYEGVYKLPAGHYMRINANKEVQFVRWYTPLQRLATQGYATLSEEEHSENLRSALRASVHQQMMADVPYGVFLSGGIDSSLNVALMSAYTPRVKTFTITCADGPEYNERYWARRVARTFNTEHHEIEINEQDAFNAMHTLLYHHDEPLGDCVSVPLLYVARLLKQAGVTVVQVGEGSDELFCGYQTYAQYLNWYNRYWRPSQLLPQVVRQGMYHAARHLFPTRHHKLQLMHSWATNKHPFWSGALAFAEYAKQSLLRLTACTVDPVVEALFPGLVQGYDSYEWVAYHLKTLYQQVPRADFFTSMLYLECMQRLPELLLMRVDKMTMLSSVEARVPYLDHTLVEYAFTIPTALKYRNNTTKYILKKAAETLLPHDIIYRPKMGFAAPTKRWFKEGAYFKPALQEMLHSHGPWTDIFNMHALQELFAHHQQQNADCSLPLWVVYNVLSLSL